MACRNVFLEVKVSFPLLESMQVFIAQRLRLFTGSLSYSGQCQFPTSCMLAFSGFYWDVLVCGDFPGGKKIHLQCRSSIPGLGRSPGEGNGNPLQYPCLENPMDRGPGGLQSMGSQSRTRLSDFTFTFHFHALEKEMATHSSILASRIPGTGEPGGLPSMGSHRVGHDWSDLAAAVLFC